MSARSKTKSQLPATVDDKPGAAARALSQIIERGARVQGPAVRAYVERLREGSPDATPAEIVTKLEKQYLAAVMASGAAVGSAAAIPGIGTLAALSAVAGETVVFLEATALFVLAVAEVHGIPAEHRERRRALVLAVLVGEDSKHAIAELLGPGRTKGAWLSDGAATLPLPAVSQLNSRLLRYFVKRYALRRGAIMFGKLLPVGIGAVVGGVGNRLMGKRIIEQRAYRVRFPAAALAVEIARAAGAAGLKSSLRRLALLSSPRLGEALAFRRRRCGVPQAGRKKEYRRASVRSDSCRTEGIEASSCREQFNFTIRTERVVGRGDVSQVPRRPLLGRSELA